jgi:hypothetical protein
MGLSAEEAGALEDEWSIVKRQLFGLPDPGPWTSGEILMDRYKEYIESLPEEPRETGKGGTTCPGWRPSCCLTVG